MQFTGSADRLPPATPPPLPPDCLLPPILNAITLTHFWHKQFLDHQARPFPLDQKCLSGSGFSSVPFFLRLRSPLSFVCECECVFMCCATFSCLSLGSSSSSSSSLFALGRPSQPSQLSLIERKPSFSELVMLACSNS